ncbi:MAG: outer-membrane lipoprotein carrier protein LolA [Prevotella sp.]|nr:outer-membrane lipoprotein carrier protein LolA [Prevotella sp.]
MKKIVFALMLMLGVTVASYAQTAKQVLDKCAATISSKDGVKADFTMQSAQYGNLSGKIAVKGKMFHATTSAATMWFDGKTLWTYMAKNEEVNVTSPSEAQLQVLNPYNFINMYKKGFTYTMTQTDKVYNVHLTASDKTKRVQEMFITVDKATSHPAEVKLLQKQKWTTFTIENLQTTKLADAEFRFNSKDFPSAEVIDLR